MPARVDFVDTDGDTIAFMRESGGINYYVNGKLKVGNLTTLWADERGRIHVDGTSAGAWSAVRRTTPKDRGVLEQVRDLANGGSGDLGAVEFSYKDTDGDNILFIRKSNNKVDYYVNGDLKCFNCTVKISGRTIHLEGQPSGNWSGSRRSTPNATSALEHVKALISGNGLQKLAERQNVGVRLVKTSHLIQRTAGLDQTSVQLKASHWDTYAGISEIFGDDSFVETSIGELPKQDYAVITYTWEGALWSDISHVLQKKMRAPYAWIDIFCLNQCLPDSEKMRVIKESGNIYADATEYHFLGLMSLDRLWCLYELALGVSPKFSAGDDFGRDSPTAKYEASYLDKLKRQARSRKWTSVRVADLLKPVAPKLEECSCSVEKDRGIVSRQIVEQHGSVTKFNDRVATILAGNARWNDHVAAISSALQSSGDDTSVSEVAFVDTDGDAIVFKKRTDGAVDYWVNGAPKVNRLTQLSLRGSTLSLDGTSAGSWGSQRRTTPDSYEAALRVMDLFHGTNSAQSAQSVAFKDTDGDAIVFMINGDGRIDYYVNNRPKVLNLTKLAAQGRTLHLDGTSAGSWGSQRRTTPYSMHVADRVLDLAKGRM